MKILSCYKIWPVLFAVAVSTPTIALAQNQSVETVSLFDLPLEKLMNVEITTAGKTHERIKDVPASVAIVTRKEIERYGYTTLTDILENVPGLYNIYSYNGAPGNFGVRGFWNPFSQNSNIAFMINGVKQINDDSQSTPMAKITVPVEAIDRIEIIKGPMSVIYGSGASFGAINIITNEISDNNNVSLVSTTYGSRDTRKVAMRVSETMDDMQFVVNASHYETDGLNNKFSDMMSPGNQALLPFLGVTDPNYSTDGLLENKNDYLGISGSYKNFYLDATIQQTDIDIYAIAPSLRSGNERASDNFSLLLGYRDNINNMVSYDANLAYFDHEDGDVLDFFDPTSFGTRNVKYKTWEAEFVATIKPDNQWNIIAGINQRTMMDHLEIFDVPAAQADPVNMVTPIKQKFSRDNRTTQALFTQATYTPTTKVVFVAGLRWENNPSYNYSILENIGLPGENLIQRHASSKDNLLPRFAAIYHYNDHNTLKFLYGKASKIVSDDSNLPERTETIEVNYIYNKEHYFLSASIFHNKLDDLFTQDITTLPSGQFAFSTKRSGKIESHGLELITKGQFSENMLGELDYTYQRTEDKENNTDAAYSPDSVVQAKLSYRKQLNTLSLLGRYTSSMFPPSNVGDTISSNTIFDLNYRIDDFIGKAYFNLKLTNIFDEEIRYPNNIQFNELLDRGTIGPDRSIFGTLGWKF